LELVQVCPASEGFASLFSPINPIDSPRRLGFLFPDGPGISLYDPPFSLAPFDSTISNRMVEYRMTRRLGSRPDLNFPSRAPFLLADRNLLLRPVLLACSCVFLVPPSEREASLAETLTRSEHAPTCLPFLAPFPPDLFFFFGFD